MLFSQENSDTNTGECDCQFSSLNPLKSELFTKQACRDVVVIYSLFFSPKNIVGTSRLAAAREPLVRDVIKTCSKIPRSSVVFKD